MTCPLWSTGYDSFRTGRHGGPWSKINDALRTQVRHRDQRTKSLRQAIIDTPSIKTTEQGGPRGKDPHTRINGRKRHLVVDTRGLVVAAVGHAADIQDRDGAKRVLEKLVGRFPAASNVADQRLASIVKKRCTLPVGDIDREIDGGYLRLVPGDFTLAPGGPFSEIVDPPAGVLDWIRYTDNLRSGQKTRTRPRPPTVASRINAVAVLRPHTLWNTTNPLAGMIALKRPWVESMVEP